MIIKVLLTFHLLQLLLLAKLLGHRSYHQSCLCEHLEFSSSSFFESTKGYKSANQDFHPVYSLARDNNIE